MQQNANIWFCIVLMYIQQIILMYIQQITNI